jgi:multiple sugar transport system ATP-binding protein
LASVELSHVSKRFDKVVAVDDVSLTVEDKEFLVLVGPSGCGKSTTLRLVAGLEDQTSGSIAIGGRDVSRLSPRDRDIAMVFQSYALYPHMSVYNNMAFGLKVRKTPRAVIRERVREAARTLELEDLLTRKPRELSGGQRQRVALGRAIVREPAVFLMDEPLSNLDALLRAQTRRLLTALHRRLEATFVYVTHDQTEAMTMGMRIAVMNRGKVQQVDAPQAIYDRPRNLFVATFIGTPQVNVLPGEFMVVSEQRSFRSGEVEVALSPAFQLPGRQAAVTGAFRPEDVSVGSTDGADLHGVVDLLEHTGPDAYATISLPSTSVTVRLDAHARVRVGERVGVTIDPTKMHFFDDSGERIEASAT